MKRATVLAILKIQYVLGFIFALLGTCVGVVVFMQFRVTGVPIAGSNQTLSALSCAIIISATAIGAGLAASLVAKHQLRKFQ